MNDHPSTAGGIAPPLVDSTGTARRLQALVALGYSQNELAARLGLSAPRLSVLIHQSRPHVTITTYRRVRALYGQLWIHPITGPAGDQARAIAHSHNWVGALAWDDIDDPAEKPNIRGIKQERPKGKTHIDEIAVERVIHGEKVKLTRPEKLEVVRRLHALRWSDKRISKVLRISESTVLRMRRDELKLPAFDQSEIRKVNSA